MRRVRTPDDGRAEQDARAWLRRARGRLFPTTAYRDAITGEWTAETPDGIAALEAREALDRLVDTRLGKVPAADVVDAARRLLDRRGVGYASRHADAYAERAA